MKSKMQYLGDHVKLFEKGKRREEEENSVEHTGRGEELFVLMLANPQILLLLNPQVS